MDEQANIKASHQALVSTIEEARTIIRGAVAEFFTRITQAETLCEKAREIAQSWNRESEELQLPEHFLVNGFILLNYIREAVEPLDIRTPEGVLTRKPLSSEDLAPRHRRHRPPPL
jgi:hypothetical protein